MAKHWHRRREIMKVSRVVVVIVVSLRFYLDRELICVIFVFYREFLIISSRGKGSPLVDPGHSWNVLRYVGM